MKHRVITELAFFNMNYLSFCVQSAALGKDFILKAKQLGFSDKQIAECIERLLT